MSGGATTIFVRYTGIRSMRSKTAIFCLFVGAYFVVGASLVCESVMADEDFFSGRVFPTGQRPVEMATADFNADGLIDAACCNFESNDVSVFLGIGNGEFLPSVSYPTGQGPRSITLSLSLIHISEPTRPY